MLFPAILPWLVIVGLNYSHGRSIALLVVDEDQYSAHPPPSGAVGAGDAATGACSQCGGGLSIHPKTQEIFCTACGDGLGTTKDIIVDERAAYEFVEQEDPATSQPSPEPGSTIGALESGACTLCGGGLAVLSMTQEVYCTSCGAGLPSTQVAPAPAQAPAPTPVAAPTHVHRPPTPAPSPPPAAPSTTWASASNCSFSPPLKRPRLSPCKIP